MRPVTLYLGGIKDPAVLAALTEIQKASHDTLQNDSSSSGGAISTLVGATLGSGGPEIPYFTDQYHVKYLPIPIAAADGGTGATKYNPCRIYLAGTQTGVAINTQVIVNFDTVDFDPDGIADLVNHRIKPNAAGTYLATTVVYETTGTSAGFTEAAPSIRKNGVAIATTTGTVVNNEAAPCVSTLVQMNGTTDYLEASAFAVAASGTITVGFGAARGCFLNCVRVGP